MTRVLLLGADGAAARGVKNCLKLAGGYEIAESDHAWGARTDDELLTLIDREQPHVVHAQPDEEVERVSRLRSEIRNLGCAVFLPRKEVITLCQDKWETYKALKRCEVPVPDTDLPGHWKRFDGKILHVRPRRGAGGKKSFQGTWRQIREVALPASEGWSKFTLAERLPGPTVTWQGIYSNGRLIVSQQRRRLAWTHGDRGSCLVGETYSDALHNKIALDAVFAVDMMAHGIWGVDMTLDAEGYPRVTEINIGRFFTTIEFFAQAGVNFPDIAMRLALGEDVEPIGSNPLPNHLRWERAIDALPVLKNPALCTF